MPRLHNTSYTQCRPVGTILLPGDSGEQDYTQAKGVGGFWLRLYIIIGFPPSIVPLPHLFYSLVKTFHKLLAQFLPLKKITRQYIIKSS